MVKESRLSVQEVFLIPSPVLCPPHPYFVSPFSAPVTALPNHSLEATSLQRRELAPAATSEGEFSWQRWGGAGSGWQAETCPDQTPLLPCCSPPHFGVLGKAQGSGQKGMQR